MYPMFPGNGISPLGAAALTPADVQNQYAQSQANVANWPTYQAPASTFNPQYTPDYAGWAASPTYQATVNADQQYQQQYGDWFKSAFDPATMNLNPYKEGVGPVPQYQKPDYSSIPGGSATPPDWSKGISPSAAYGPGSYTSEAAGNAIKNYSTGLAGYQKVAGTHDQNAAANQAAADAGSGSGAASGAGSGSGAGAGSGVGTAPSAGAGSGGGGVSGAGTSGAGSGAGMGAGGNAIHKTPTTAGGYNAGSASGRPRDQAEANFRKPSGPSGMRGGRGVQGHGNTPTGEITGVTGTPGIGPPSVAKRYRTGFE